MKETELRVKQNELENKLEDKQKDVDRLDKMLELVKQECNSQVNQKVRYRRVVFLYFIWFRWNRGYRLVKYISDVWIEKLHVWYGNVLIKLIVF